ncbi:MAG: glucokinase [Candidatus Woesearchaeota archaeon]
MFTKKYLLADIGGTTTRLAIVNQKFEFIKKSYYKNSDIKDVNDQIIAFAILEKVNAGCIAVAGLVGGDRTSSRLTNINWFIDAKKISSSLKAKILLLNDFEALGMSIDSLKREQYEELTTKGIDLSGTISLIGAGTGLGMSILYSNNKKHYPLPSEGGHSSIVFNPESKLEMDLYKFMKKKKIPLEVESLVSGRGIITIYEFLLSKKLKHDKKIMQEIKKGIDKPSLITKYAMQDKDLLCIKTLEIFILFYSRIAQDLALKTLCSTLVIGGGIAQKIVPVLQEHFLDAFLKIDNIQSRKLLENMSIIVLTDPDLTLNGCYNAI